MFHIIPHFCGILLFICADASSKCRAKGDLAGFHITHLRLLPTSCPLLLTFKYVVSLDASRVSLEFPLFLVLFFQEVGKNWMGQNYSRCIKQVPVIRANQLENIAGKRPALLDNMTSFPFTIQSFNIIHVSYLSSLFNGSIRSIRFNSF